MIQEERERNRPAGLGVLQAVRRYPVMAIVPIVLFAALGVALGLAREPTYTATAQLSVGELNIADPAAIGSVVQATESLASVYARRIQATEVRQNIRRQVGNTSFSSTVSATPVPDSPIVKVSATGDDQRSAVIVANAAAKALAAYARKLSDPTGGSGEVYARFRATALKVTEQRDTLRRLKRAYNRDSSEANQRAVNKAQADLDTTLLRREGLRANYQTSQQNARSTPPLSTFALATDATSDRRSVTQILLLLGLIAGAAVGAALATLRLNRRIAQLNRP